MTDEKTPLQFHQGIFLSPEATPEAVESALRRLEAEVGCYICLYSRQRAWDTVKAILTHSWPTLEDPHVRIHVHLTPWTVQDNLMPDLVAVCREIAAINPYDVGQVSALKAVAARVMEELST